MSDRKIIEGVNDTMQQPDMPNLIWGSKSSGR